MKKIPLLLIFLFTVSPGFTQVECKGPTPDNSSSPLHLSFRYKPVVMLKFLPLALIDKEPNYQGGIEVRIFKNLSFNQDIGWFLPAFQWHPDFAISKRRGTVLKTELKWYLWHPAKPASPLEGFYLAGQVFAKRVKNASFRIDISGCDEPAEWVYVYYDKIVKGGHLKMGYQFGMKRMYADVYLGTGWRTIARYYQNIFDLPDDNVRDYDADGSSPAFDYQSVPSMQAGVRLGILL
jgi:hypothetical protein